MYNVMSSTYIGGFTVNTTTQGICNSQNKNETNTTTAFTIEHDKFEQLFFFTAHMMFIIYWWTNCVLNFKINLNDITFKKKNMHAHSLSLCLFQNIYTVKSSTNVTTINISNIT